MTNQYQLTQIKDRYLDSLNRVNLLLLKQHDLRKDENLYKQELQKVNMLITQIKNNRLNSTSIISQDSFLREQITQNQKQIRKLELKLKGQEITEIDNVRQVQERYLIMISQEFQNAIQQRLSTIRGKVDELKKKIKEINKEILGYEQEHLEGIDEYSLCLTILRDYEMQNKALREDIAKLKASRK